MRSGAVAVTAFALAICAGARAGADPAAEVDKRVRANIAAAPAGQADFDATLAKDALVVRSHVAKMDLLDPGPELKCKLLLTS